MKITLKFALPSLALFACVLPFSAVATNPTASWGVELSKPDASINTWDRAAVEQLFRDHYVANHWLPINNNAGADWTNATTYGTYDESIQQSMLDQINCLRRLTGVGQLTRIEEDAYEHFLAKGAWLGDYYYPQAAGNYYYDEDARWAAFVQTALYAEKGDIEHTLPLDFKWYRDEAAVGTMSSCIAIDTGYPRVDGSWPDPIQGFCWEGIDNKDAGHMYSLIGSAYAGRAYVATCPFYYDAKTKSVGAATATPNDGNMLSAVITVNTPYVNNVPVTPFDDTQPYQWSYPTEGYFPKGFIPVYWCFEPYGKTYTWTSINNGNSPDVTVTKNGVKLDGVKAWFVGSEIVFSLPTLTDKVANDYATAIDGLRSSVLKDDLGEPGDVVYEVTIKVRVSSAASKIGDSDYSDMTYQYTVVAFDWSDAGRLTYQIFPDEYQVGYNWKYTAWLGYYYTAGHNWIYSEKMDDWLYVCDAGTFGHSGEIYTGKTASGKMVWDVPSAAQADYGFWAWSTKRNAWLWISPTKFPSVYDCTLCKWVNL